MLAYEYRAFMNYTSLTAKSPFTVENGEVTFYPDIIIYHTLGNLS